MFEKVEVLSKEKHQDLKFTPANNFGFAKSLNTVPLSYSELVQASKFYPIVFPSQGTPVPQALLSLKQGENVFINENGQWTVPYIPAHIRRYPFILGQADEEGNYAVCIDPDAPHFSSDQGDPLYATNGEPAEVVNKAIEFLKRYQGEMIDTEKIFTALQDKGLLVDKQFNIGSGDNQFTVKGFKAIDTEKLKEVENEMLANWVKQGIMGLIYAHLHSMDNVRALAAGQGLQREAA